MKKLVIYYCCDGNTAFIARIIADAAAADVLGLRLRDDREQDSFLKYLKGTKQVLTNETPELLPYDKNPEDYDMLFVGTPVWALGYAPALNSFFAKVSFKGKKIALFCCSTGGIKGKVIEKMKERLAGNEFVGEIDFINPLKKDKEKNMEKARQWVKEVCP